MKFNYNFLCTAPDLNTDCAMTKKTACLEGRDEVYFVDTCGNPANIYDSSRVEDINYWTKVVEPSESCGAESGNAGSKGCGNCDYLGGSICKKQDGATYGDYMCTDLSCKGTSNGKDYANGESWCVWDDNDENSATVGSLHYRHVCFAGEETVEMCDNFRVGRGVCVEDDIDGFSQAGCVVNRWDLCILQEKPKDCLNSDLRDCVWIPFDEKNMVVGKTLTKYSDIENVRSDLINVNVEDAGETGKCVPKVAPGLVFWDESSAGHCAIGNQQCVVKYEKGLLSKKKCVENCECLEESTAKIAQLYCSSLGDCGPKKNFVGVFVNEGYEINIGKKSEEPIVNDKAATPGGATNFGGAGATATAGQFTGEQGQPFTSATETSTPAPAGNVIQGFVTKLFGGKN